MSVCNHFDDEYAGVYDKNGRLERRPTWACPHCHIVFIKKEEKTNG